MTNAIILQMKYDNILMFIVKIFVHTLKEIKSTRF